MNADEATLGHIGSILDALENESFTVRLGATVVLRGVKDARAVEPLIKALGDENPHVREGAAAALGELMDPRASEPLRKALADQESIVRAAAAAALDRCHKRRTEESFSSADCSGMGATDRRGADLAAVTEAAEVKAAGVLAKAAELPATKSDSGGTSCRDEGEEFKFYCTVCGQPFRAPLDMVGEQIDCPACRKSIIVPDPRPATASTVSAASDQPASIDSPPCLKAPLSGETSETEMLAEDDVPPVLIPAGANLAGGLGKDGGGSICRATFSASNCDDEAPAVELEKAVGSQKGGARAIYCTLCGFKNMAVATFCTACGAKLHAVAAGNAPVQESENKTSLEGDKEFKFYCAKCSQPLRAPVDMAGEPVECPGCRAMIKIPLGESAGKAAAAADDVSAPAASGTREGSKDEQETAALDGGVRCCTQCGCKNMSKAQFCTTCGAKVAASPAPSNAVPQSSGSTRAGGSVASAVVGFKNSLKCKLGFHQWAGDQCVRCGVSQVLVTIPASVEVSSKITRSSYTVRIWHSPTTLTRSVARAIHEKLQQAGYLIDFCETSKVAGMFRYSIDFPELQRDVAEDIASVIKGVEYSGEEVKLNVDNGVTKGYCDLWIWAEEADVMTGTEVVPTPSAVEYHAEAYGVCPICGVRVKTVNLQRHTSNCEMRNASGQPHTSGAKSKPKRVDSHVETSGSCGAGTRAPMKTEDMQKMLKDPTILKNAFLAIVYDSVDGKIRLRMSGSRVTGIWVSRFPKDTFKEAYLLAFLSTEKLNGSFSESVYDGLCHSIYESEFTIDANASEGGFNVVFF